MTTVSVSVAHSLGSAQFSSVQSASRLYGFKMPDDLSELSARHIPFCLLNRRKRVNFPSYQRLSRPCRRDAVSNPTVLNIATAVASVCHNSQIWLLSQHDFLSVWRNVY